MKKIALMFPGQGSQAVGMGKDIHEEYSDVRQLFKEADQVLNKNLSGLMFEGPKEELTETENAQPALLLSSIALHTLLLKEEIQPVMAVGHSLGEYSALVAAGSLSIEDALPLVATRGRLMEEAFPKGQGTMAAVLGLDEETIAASLAKVEGETVNIANLNCPGQVVISGSQAGVEQATSLLKEHGAKRVLPLNVSGPFHSKLMQPASEAFSHYLDEVKITDASIPVYANVSAKPVTDSGQIRELLIEQLYSPVRFEESIRHMLDEDVDAIVEVGNGKVLSGLVKKIDKRVKTFAVQDTASLQEFISWYKEEA
ncbi:ACP S-malonyltransferase [Oceanobacillus manasiensis]|uniref:ACP S-malonyltransferase n=1 Tax=Oceanobacillus manasiensis TaxID=586413 RepID=UPI0005A5F459|nr:ACP S-malonyltransferase [Oceanobacillus manasiensis]